MLAADHARFVARARREAARYGSRPLVFLRELVQNARDAGASRVEFVVEERGDGCRIRCHDDGCGMTAEHARQFLFRLYASSKGHVGEAGRFGVGFWSVLRFEPERLVVRSRQAGAAAWGVDFDGGLTSVTTSPPPADFAPGTEVMLERAAPWPDLAAAVRAALREQVRDVRRRDRPGERLSIRLAGEELNAPLALANPSASFEAGAERGVVGLAPAPRVEVFSLGLRVRDAQTLDELLGGPAARAWCAVPGLAPAMVLESARVAPLLSRADLRADAALRRLERRARAALRRLMDAELARLHPPTLGERFSGVFRAWPGVTAFLATLVLGLGVLAAVVGPRRVASEAATNFGPAASAAPAPPLRAPATAVGEVPLSSALGLTREPGVGVVHGDEPAIALRFTPVERSTLLALRRTPAAELRSAPAATHADAAAPRDDPGQVVEWRVRVRVRDGGGAVPLPTAIGTDVARIRPQPTRWLVRAGEPPHAEFAPGFAGWVEYELVAGATDPPPAAVSPRPLPLPARLAEAARVLRTLPVARRPEAALAFVQGALREARDAEAMRRFASAPGADFASRALAAGVGDCDVLNGVLVLLLDGAGLPSRLAVGVVARDGRAEPGLHAWAETHDGERWIALDATRPGAAPAAAPGLQAAPLIAAPAPVEVAVARQPLPPGESAGADRGGWFAAIAGVAVLAAVVLWRRRERRAAVSPGATSVDDLLRGALRHPEAFSGAPAVFDRPLLARAGGGHVSLGEAWREAATGRLYRAGDGSRALVREARARRGVVLDDRSATAATVADALGALDLEAWDERWRAAEAHPVLKQLEQACARHGLRFEARLGPGARIEALPLAARGPRPRLLIGRDSGPWRAFASLPPARATFELARDAVRPLVVPAAQAVPVLRVLARAALAEGAR
ncbi:MAG: ATP-binding protein [Vicinamibacteria bacterium]|nr:ATP-binding protein [Vicinamibacteria bacterium]